MGISKELEDTEVGFKIVESLPKFRKLPIILTEADPEGCAACSARVYPPNAYRNGTLYPAYEAAAFNGMLQLEDRHKLNLEGILTWAFEFEDQPYFDGFRTLATNGIDKPVLNFFRMAGMLGGDRIKTQSDGAVGLDTMLTAGVRDRPTVDALATRSSRGISVMVWNYQDEDVAGPAATVDLELEGLPKDTTHVLVRHYRIDQITAMHIRSGKISARRNNRATNNMRSSRRQGSYNFSIRHIGFLARVAPAECNSACPCRRFRCWN